MRLALGWVGDWRSSEDRGPIECFEGVMEHSMAE